MRICGFYCNCFPGQRWVKTAVSEADYCTDSAESSYVLSRTENMQETPYLLRKDNYPSLPSTYCLWGGGGVYFASHLSYLWSSACAVHLLFFGTDAHCTAVYTNSFYPVNWITSENRWREQLLPKQLITRSPLVTVHMFLCTCTMLILI